LVRWAILFGKKRGQRRSGSHALGRAGLGLFAAVFFAAGVISLAFILLKLSIPEWRANHQFIATTCQVLATRAETDSAGLTRPEVQVRYTVDGRELRAWSLYDITGVYQSDAQYTQNILDKFQTGQEYPGWYDPRQPETVVLARGYTWFAWLMLAVPAAFISIGGGGLIYSILTWGKSTERLAATAQTTPGLDFFMPPAKNAPPDPFPNVPNPQQSNDSPGTFLAYRLPAGTAGWSLVATAVVCVLWNVAVAVFVRMDVQSFQRGEPDWWLTIFIVPFAIVGVGFLVLLARALLIETGIGPTLVEISAHPLTPGGKYDIYISQAGQMEIKSLAVKLVCEETATYRQGTNTRKATRRVFERVLVTAESLALGRALPFEARAHLEVPGDAMHSFKAAHNRIDWKIVVKGAVTRWPDFERSFPVIVRPGQDGERRG
jgi:hypothetical protein